MLCEVYMYSIRSKIIKSLVFSHHTNQILHLSLFWQFRRFLDVVHDDPFKLWSDLEWGNVASILLEDFRNTALFASKLSEKHFAMDKVDWSSVSVFFKHFVAAAQSLHIMSCYCDLWMELTHVVLGAMKYQYPFSAHQIAYLLDLLRRLMVEAGGIELAKETLPSKHPWC